MTFALAGAAPMPAIRTLAPAVTVKKIAITISSLPIIVSKLADGGAPVAWLRRRDVHRHRATRPGQRPAVATVDRDVRRGWAGAHHREHQRGTDATGGMKLVDSQCRGFAPAPP